MRENKELTVAVDEVLQGPEGARLPGLLRLLLVPLQHLVHVGILDAGQSPGAERQVENSQDAHRCSLNQPAFMINDGDDRSVALMWNRDGCV